MLGSNVPTIGGLPKGFKYAEEWGCEAIQVYVSLSRKWDVPALSFKEICEFKSSWKTSSVKEVVAHVPFLVNLASPDDELWEKSVSRLTTEINRANKFGVRFLVLHPGSYIYSTPANGLRRIIKGLNTTMENVDKRRVKVLLETMAGQGTTIGSRFEEIAYILDRLNHRDLYGVCFDTGHVFMAGYNFSGYEGYQDTLNLFDEIVGIDHIMVIHLNDSKADIGSKKDRHACIGEGKMGLQVFHALVRDPRFSGVAKILEIPERDEKSRYSLELLQKLKMTEECLCEAVNHQLTLW